MEHAMSRKQGIALAFKAVATLLMSLWAATSHATTELYYVHTDHLGTPQVMTDKNQEVVWERSQTPFGETVEDTGTLEQPLRFPGQYQDRETGFSYNYYRDYDPGLGRYVQSDPIGLGGGLNTYGYVSQNPLKYIDPTGEYAQCAVWPVGTAACAAAGAGYAYRAYRAYTAAQAINNVAAPYRNEGDNDTCSPEDAVSGADRPNLIPPEWGDGQPNKKKPDEGRRWQDPDNKGNGVRIDKGNPNNPWPSQQVDHVVVNDGGKIIDANGKPINAPKPSATPEAHIPYSQWRTWGSWNSP